MSGTRDARRRGRMLLGAALAALAAPTGCAGNPHDELPPDASPGLTCITFDDGSAVDTRISYGRLTEYNLIQIAGDEVECPRRVPANLTEVHGWSASGLFHSYRDGGYLRFVDAAKHPPLIRGGPFVEQRSVEWAPRGDAVAYVTEGELHLAWPEDGALVTRSLGPGGSRKVWSPDGANIAYTAPGGIFLVEAVRPPGPEPVLLSAEVTGNIDRMVWAASSAELAVATRQGLWVLAVEDQRARRITSQRVTEVGWSPNGAALWYVANDTYLVAADGASPPQQLVPASAYRGLPTWSPDGRYLAFQRKLNQADAHLVLARVDGARVDWTHVLDGFVLWIDDSNWSPDGSMLAVGMRVDGSEIVDPYLVELWGDVPSDLISLRPGVSIYAGMRGGGVRWSPDHRHLAFLGTGGYSGRLSLFVASVSVDPPLTRPVMLGDFRWEVQVNGNSAWWHGSSPRLLFGTREAGALTSSHLWIATVSEEDVSLQWVSDRPTMRDFAWSE